MNSRSSRQTQPPVVGPRPSIPTSTKLPNRGSLQRGTPQDPATQLNDYEVPENIYNELINNDEPLENAANPYAGLLLPQEDVLKNVCSRLGELELRQNQLSQDLLQSEQKIVSEISHLKDIVSSLHLLMMESVTKSQKMSEETDKMIEVFASNLGHEVFQVGQEIMGSLKQLSETEKVRETNLGREVFRVGQEITARLKEVSEAEELRYTCVMDVLSQGESGKDTKKGSKKKAL